MQTEEQKTWKELFQNLSFRHWMSLIWGLTIYVMCIATLFHVGRFLFHAQPRFFWPDYVPVESWATSLVVDLLLIFLFCGQHSFMASSLMKDIWNNSNVQLFQRSTYTLATAVVLEILVSFWKPIEYVMWDWGSSWDSTLFIIYICGWFLILLETLMMDHFELLGLKQIYFAVQGWNEPMKYKNNLVETLYSHSRHPILLGLLIILWSTPVMTVDHFFLCLVFIFYELLWNNIDKDDIQYVEDSLKNDIHLILQQRPNKVNNLLGH